MASAAVPRRLPRLLGAALLLVLTTGVWTAATAPAEAAQTHEVEVRNTSGGGSLHPASLEIRTGDTVVWRWVANEWHTVDVAEHDRTTCNPLDLNQGPCDGHTLEVTFDAVGEFRVRDEVTGTTGTVVVTTPPPPKPTPSSPSATPSEPSPSEPTADPSPTETEPTSPPTTSPATEAPPTEATEPPPPPPTAGTAAPPPVDTATPPDATPTMRDPSVASADATPSPVPEPTFEDFPEPVDPTEVDAVEGEVALGAPGGGGARVLWGVVGGVTVLGTLGAFGRAVLFSDPWQP